MRNNLYVIFLSVVILLASGTIYAQEQKKSQTSVRFKDGLTVVFTSETDPPQSNRQTLASVQIDGDNNIIRRVYTDTERGVYFGYDVVVEPLAESEQFKLSFLPLSIEPFHLLLPPPKPPRPGSAGGGAQPPISQRQVAKLTLLSLSKYPDAQIVGDGDTVAFDVLVNSKTGVKIVDLIKVLTSSNQPIQPLSSNGQTTASGGGVRPTRDFSADAVGFKITASRLIINGTPVNESTGKFGIGVTGALVWVYAPGRGRFILSLAPREGYNFQKTGTIQGSKISFSMGGNQYEWVSASPIVASENDNWNLWVLHDPDYFPDYAGAKADSYLFGAADSIEFLIKKK